MPSEIIAEIAIALLAFLGTLIGSIMVSQKTLWRIQELEKKVEKHNQLVERVTALEMKDQAQWKWIDLFKEEREIK